MKILHCSNAHRLFLEFCKAYTERDLQKVLSLFSKGAHVWGTGEDENFQGLTEIEAQLKRDWSQSEMGKIQIISWIEPLSEDALWAAGVCRATVVINGVSHVLENLRGSIVIEKEEGLWKISHSHASFPDVRQLTGESFPTSI